MVLSLSCFKDVYTSKGDIWVNLEYMYRVVIKGQEFWGFVGFRSSLKYSIVEFQSMDIVYLFLLSSCCTCTQFLDRGQGIWWETSCVPPTPMFEGKKSASIRLDRLVMTRVEEVQ